MACDTTTFKSFVTAVADLLSTLACSVYLGFGSLFGLIRLAASFGCFLRGHAFTE